MGHVLREFETECLTKLLKDQTDAPKNPQKINKIEIWLKYVPDRHL